MMYGNGVVETGGKEKDHVILIFIACMIYTLDVATCSFGRSRCSSIKMKLFSAQLILDILMDRSVHAFSDYIYIYIWRYYRSYFIRHQQCQQNNGYCNLLQFILHAHSLTNTILSECYYSSLYLDRTNIKLPL